MSVYHNHNSCCSALSTRSTSRAECSRAHHHSHQSQTTDKFTAVSPAAALKLTVNYERLLTGSYRTERDLKSAMRLVRKMILTEGGIPEISHFKDPKVNLLVLFLSPDLSASCPDISHQQTLHNPHQHTSLRGRIWKIMLGVFSVSAAEYIGCLERGHCDVYQDKIKNDTFRTLATDQDFVGVVDEGMLSRVLNTFVWKGNDLPQSRLVKLSFSYVQGMNVLAAPLLYTLSELEAFHAFNALIFTCCPLYVQPALEGVHAGIKMFDKCLHRLDPKLHAYLKSKDVESVTYALPSIMTLSACTKPLTEVVKLWDFLLAFGVHLNVLCVVAQVVLIRNKLLKVNSPMKLLRTLPELNAKEVISYTLKFIPKLDDNLYEKLVRHSFDPLVCDSLLSEK